MGKKNSATAKRAKKKHEKDLKRKVVAAEKRIDRAARTAALEAAELRQAKGRTHDAGDGPAAMRDWKPETGIEGLALAARVPFHHAAHLAEHVVTEEKPLPAEVWLPSKVAALSTAELVERLAGLGIAADEDEIAHRTPPFGSATAYAQQTWLPRLAPAAGAHARDFVQLCACELWKRWRPEPPSEEVLLDLLFDGEKSAAVDGNDEEAIRCWIRFWHLLRPRLTPEMRTTAASGALLGDEGSLLFNWAGDFAITATLAVSRDPALGEPAAEVLHQVLEQFSGESDRWRTPLESDVGEILYTAGHHEEGERLLRACIEKRPAQAGPYVTLADCWSARKDGHAEWLARAVALLEEAAARPVEDAGDYDLDAHLESLRAHLAEVRDAPAVLGDEP